jgi:very-short-patch-repair endonuclease
VVPPNPITAQLKKIKPDLQSKQRTHNTARLKANRRQLRNHLTPAEAQLWIYLKERQLDGRKFRRQHSYHSYILDFYCPKESLAIELDGECHFNHVKSQLDQNRDQYLLQEGIKVLRFENYVVFENPKGLLQIIREQFGWQKRVSTTTPLPLTRDHPSSERRGVWDQVTPPRSR